MNKITRFFQFIVLIPAASFIASPVFCQHSLNVKDLGAKGDGRQDDYPAIQKAVDSAIHNPGSATSVYFPIGTYRISHPILLQQVVNMNNGKYLHDDVVGGGQADFCIGVAGYPEKHFEAPNMQTDFKYLKQKVDMGADFIVTQMFFDVPKYKEFVNNCRANGINVPIIPGLKPITTSKQLVALSKIFHIDIPVELSDAILACSNEKDVKEVGIQWMIQQCKELIDFGVPVLHFYTMGNPEPTKRIAQAVF